MYNQEKKGTTVQWWVMFFKHAGFENTCRLMGKKSTVVFFKECLMGSLENSDS